MISGAFPVHVQCQWYFLLMPLDRYMWIFPQLLFIFRFLERVCIYFNLYIIHIYAHIICILSTMHGFILLAEQQCYLLGVCTWGERSCIEWSLLVVILFLGIPRYWLHHLLQHHFLALLTSEKMLFCCQVSCKLVQCKWWGISVDMSVLWSGKENPLVTKFVH